MSAAESLASAESSVSKLRLAVAPTRDRAASDGARGLRRYRDLVAATDAVVVAVAAAAAVLVTTAVPALEHPDDVSLWLLAAGLVAAWLTVLSGFRTRDARMIGLGSTEYRRLTSATGALFGAIAIASLVLEAPLPRAIFVVALPLGLVGMLLSRRSWRLWLAHERSAGRCSSAALVVGPAAQVREVVATIEQSTGSAYRVVGVVLDGADAERGALRVRGVDVPTLGSIDDVAAAARLAGADAVIVAGQPKGGGDFIRDLGWNLERTTAELMIASRLANVAGPRIHFRPVERLPLMHVELPSYEGGKHLVKRALDIVLAGGGLLALAPLFGIIAVLVRLDSPGGAIFSQERIGRSGQTFRMFKFRSMVQTAEADLAALRQDSDGNGVLFKMRSDPRVTRVGRILRKFSLDELPQLWNIFIGDMSLVGPRPPLGSEVEQYENHVLRRLYIKPGLTGMWQVNGRSDLSWEESVRLDLYYVENWSLAGDLQILWRTVKVVLRPVGAY
jgi:exopolysaccharide biosynthesis polyprenyl glycosylphosphotransferase